MTGLGLSMPDQTAKTFDCPRCVKTIEFSGERPSFCPYCGINLSSTHRAHTTEQTASYVPIPTDFTIDDSGMNHSPGQNGVPAAIGGFRLTKLLGSGGMGAVYEGLSEDSGQRVAVKLLTTMAKATSGSLDRFRQEGRLASQLSHPNCVFVLSADEEAGRPYIVMELMPGATLREYVQERGPLPADEAIAKILNVIDGLIEAHRLNILHRDVKPSNCFLMADGRVKIGDFGLSKSLSVDGNLTQTGSFLGTVLYAAPEQIKGETLDFTADVYSVCATLYFLLTGQAPFQHESPTAVISRVITESPPDIRLRRPDLPRRLQKIVMRGLERQPDKRFQSLDELRNALRELVCRPITRSSLGARIAAYCIDFIVLMLAWIGLAVVETWVPFGEWPVFLLPKFFYFAATEYLWGCSLGKWVLRLRVRDACGGPPSLRHILLRTIAFLALTFGAGLAGDALFDRHGNRLVGLRLGIYVIGCLSILSTMRARNGFRGLHEWASGTRVVQLPWPRPARRIVPKEEWTPDLEPLSTVPGLPTSFGGFQPAGVMERQDKTLRLHLCDSMLRRDVFLIVRPEGGHAIGEPRKTLARPTRTRWLAGGVTEGWAWDAFLAPAGTPLPALIADGRRLGWPETVAILEQLSDELTGAVADGTMAGPIHPSHVFVRPDGQTQMLDPLGNRMLTDADGFKLIRQVAPLTLEADPNWESRPPGPIRAVMPIHAHQKLHGLCDKAAVYKTVGDFRAALHEIETLPNETVAPQRMISLALQGVLTGLPIAALLLVVGLFGLINYTSAYINKVTWNEQKRQMIENAIEVVHEYPKLEDPIRFQFVRAIGFEVA
jgi:eukaryotic-like serine/threonine-protein kinase